MNFEYTKKTQDLINKVDNFMQKHLFPHENKVYDFHRNNPWKDYPELESWKKEAKKESEAIERMQIREYGKKINDETRNKYK